VAEVHLVTVGRNKNKNSYDRQYNILVSAFKIPFFPSLLLTPILLIVSVQLIDWSIEWSKCCCCLQAKFTTVYKLLGFPPTVGRCDASRDLVTCCTPATPLHLFTSRQVTLYSVIQCVEWGRWPGTSVVGIASQWPAHIWRVTWVRLANTQTIRGNSTTIIHLAFVICTVVAAFVTMTDSGNLASDPFRYYTHTHTHSPRADVQYSLVLPYFSATSSWAIPFH
jgi:hypothetical protein